MQFLVLVECYTRFSLTDLQTISTQLGALQNTIGSEIPVGKLSTLAWKDENGVMQHY